MSDVVCPGCGIKLWRSWMASREFRGKVICTRCRDFADELENEEARKVRKKLKDQAIKNLKKIKVLS